MWKLTEIKLSNIVSFHEAHYEFQQGVATLIFGRNEDNALQPCNGSGKSSLIEAIALALTGEPLRKVKSVDEIINDDSEEAYVCVRLDNDYDNTSFTIERNISRNAPQAIECHKYDASGREIETDKTIQPTVSDYNKFILSEIGLSKDDIYNNFILCDNKYESFFDCSDRNKKEVINRFSNGVIIDESIARVQVDLAPVAERLDAAKANVICIKGSISAIERELEGADIKTANARQERKLNIEMLDERVLQCADDIQVFEQNLSKGNKRLRTLKRLQSEIKDLEESGLSILDAYCKVKSMCEEYGLEQVSDFEQLSAEYKNRLAETQQNVELYARQIVIAEDLLTQCKSVVAEKTQVYQSHVNDDEKAQLEEHARKAEILKEIKAIDLYLDQIEAAIKSNKNRQAELEAQISRSKALLNGAIACPKCHHRFFVGNQSSVEEVKHELDSLQNESARKEAELAELDKRFDDVDLEAEAKEKLIEAVDKSAKERAARLEREYEALKPLVGKVDETEDSILRLRRCQAASQTEADKLSGKLEVLQNRLFGEINGILEGRILNGSQYVEQQKSAIAFAEGQKKQYQQSIQELMDAPETDFAASLKSSMKKYVAELSEAEKILAEAQSEYDMLKRQEVDFTLFKSYIARKKIDALSLIVNDFLEKIGSDIRLKLEGFTVTKTGKLRDKISVQVMRDGVDCGSYYKFSGGEKARLNLACILSLHTLTNSNCEDGKGLDFIIIDELLDKSDEVGMAAYCEALNKLGQTSLLITQGGVSESYPHKLLIVKKHGISTISE